MTRKAGKDRDAEMRLSDTDRNPAGTSASRFQPADSSGVSSSRSRSTRSGAEHAESATSGRGGTPSGASSSKSDQHHENEPLKTPGPRAHKQ